MTAKEKLHELIEQLPEGEADHALALLAPLLVQAPRPDDESRAWEEAGLEDMAKGIEQVESSLPPDELEAWLKAADAVSQSARYVPGRGLVVGEGALSR